MPHPVLTIRHRDNNHVLGYRAFYLHYVTGFDQRKTGTACFRGDIDGRFGKTMPVGAYNLQTAGLYYLHGLPNRQDEVGIAFAHRDGEAFLVDIWGGYQILVENARRITIHPVADGFANMAARFTQSMCWQLGKQVFGFDGIPFEAAA